MTVEEPIPDGHIEIHVKHPMPDPKDRLPNKVWSLTFSMKDMPRGWSFREWGINVSQEYGNYIIAWANVLGWQIHTNSKEYRKQLRAWQAECDHDWGEWITQREVDGIMVVVDPFAYCNICGADSRSLANLMVEGDEHEAHG